MSNNFTVLLKFLENYVQNLVDVLLFIGDLVKYIYFGSIFNVFFHSFL